MIGGSITTIPRWPFHWYKQQWVTSLGYNIANFIHTWQVDTHLVLPQIKYIWIPHYMESLKSHIQLHGTMMGLGWLLFHMDCISRRKCVLVGWSLGSRSKTMCDVTGVTYYAQLHSYGIMMGFGWLLFPMGSIDFVEALYPIVCWSIGSCWMTMCDVIRVT